MVQIREATSIDRRQATLLLDSVDELMPVAYSSAGRQFRPARLFVIWTRRDNGPWRIESATAIGPVIKKDGTDSTLTGKRDLTRWVAGGDNQWRDDAPQWAVNAAAAYAPEGVSA